MTALSSARQAMVELFQKHVAAELAGDLEPHALFLSNGEMACQPAEADHKLLHYLIVAYRARHIRHLHVRARSGNCAERSPIVEQKILAFQAASDERQIQVHSVTDKPIIAKSVLESQGLAFPEVEVVQARLPHRPGELARAASRLGEANINISYAYGGVDLGTNGLFVILGVGVAEVGRAVAILDKHWSPLQRPSRLPAANGNRQLKSSLRPLSLAASCVLRIGSTPRAQKISDS